jgi:dipeptide/tripeptide permease
MIVAASSARTAFARLMTYIVVGPAVACVAFSLLTALLVEEAEVSSAEISSLVFLAMPAVIGVFYVLGWKAAAFVGALMALIEPRLARPWVSLVMATLLGGFVTALLFPPLLTGGVTRDIVLGSASVGAVAGLASAAIDRVVQTRLLSSPKPTA